MFMDAVEIELLKLEDFAYHQVRNWDRGAAKKMCAGEICSSCRRPLPLPHTPVSKRCALCAGSHHVRMTFFYFGGWHCRFYSERWQPLPKRLTFRKDASVVETAARGNGLIEDGVGAALERSMRIGRGGIMLRLSDDQFTAIGGVLPASPSLADKTGAGTEDSSP